MNNPLKYLDPLGLVFNYAMVDDPELGWTVSPSVERTAPRNDWFKTYNFLRSLGYYNMKDYGDYSSGRGRRRGGHSQGAVRSGQPKPPDIDLPPISPILNLEFSESYFWYRYGPNAFGIFTETNTTLYTGGVVGVAGHFENNAMPEGYSYVGAYKGGYFGWTSGLYYAWGSGPWEGPFNNFGVSIGPVSIGYFESSSWRGLGFGFGIGTYGVTSGFSYWSRFP